MTADNWPGFPASFAAGVDAAVLWTTVKALVSKPVFSFDGSIAMLASIEPDDFVEKEERYGNY
jgi:hypothetical protein